MADTAQGSGDRPPSNTDTTPEAEETSPAASPALHGQAKCAFQDMHGMTTGTVCRMSAYDHTIWIADLKATSNSLQGEDGSEC